MKVCLNFGVSLFEFGPRELVAIAKKAEQCGFHSIWCGEHLILPKDLPARDVTRRDFPIRKLAPSSPNAKLMFRQGAPMPDVFQWFTWMACATTRLAFGTAVYILPLRSPIVAARAAATFDLLSGGRLFFGVGAGWLPDEYEIVGEEFGTRGRRMDEAIQIARELWEKEEPEFRGEFYSFAPARFDPKPAQRPGPPILIGGESAPAMRRAARLGDGWCARLHTPASLRERVGKLRALREEFGRGDKPFIIQCRIERTASAGEFEALADAGAEQLAVSFLEITDAHEVIREIERVANTVLATLGPTAQP